MQNTQIVSFNELEKFTSLTELTDGGKNKGFYNCTNLRYIKLPNSLVKMGGGIEYGASIFNHTAIEELVIPEKVKTIGSQNALFSYMPNLRRIEFKCKFINTTYQQINKKK